MKRLLPILILALAACGSTGDDDDDNSPTPSPSPVSFASDVVPAFGTAGCTGASCHGTAEVGNLGLGGACATVFAELMETSARGLRVNTTSPAASVLLTFPVDAGLLSTSDPEYSVWLQWIEQGAADDCP